MEAFHEKRLLHWDYMWRDQDGRRFVGTVLFPGQRKKQGRYLWEMKKKLIEAYKSQNYIAMTILHEDVFLDLDARVWSVKEAENSILLKDAAGNYYPVRMNDILYIGTEHDQA